MPAHLETPVYHQTCQALAIWPRQVLAEMDTPFNTFAVHSLQQGDRREFRTMYWKGYPLYVYEVDRNPPWSKHG